MGIEVGVEAIAVVGVDDCPSVGPEVVRGSEVDAAGRPVANENAELMVEGVPSRFGLFPFRVDPVVVVYPLCPEAERWIVWEGEAGYRPKDCIKVAVVFGCVDGLGPTGGS